MSLRSYRWIEYSLESFEELNFLILLVWKPEDTLPKYLVFFDNIKKSQKVAKWLQERLLLEECHKVVWFNSDCIPEFHKSTTEAFQEKKTTLFDLYCIDSFEMVSEYRFSICDQLLTMWKSVDIRLHQIWGFWQITLFLTLFSNVLKCPKQQIIYEILAQGTRCKRRW